MKRKVKLCVSCIISLLILSLYLVPSFAYSEEYPDYLNLGNCAYIECRTNLGTGTIVLPIQNRQNSVSINDNVFQNVTNTTVNGYFIALNGTRTQIRGQYLNNFQYPLTTGYNTVYTDVTFTEILNTNIKFCLAEETEDNNVFVISDFEKLLLITIIVSVVFCPFVYILVCSFLIRKRG